MKKLSKKTAIIGSAAIILVFIIIIAVTLLIPKEPKNINTAAPSNTSGLTVAPTTDMPTIPDITEAPSETTPTEDSTGDLHVDLTPDKTEDVKTGSNSTSKKAEESAEPIKPTTPAKEPDKSEGGIQIGGGEPATEKYSCGSPNHHCVNAENHAYILNLEKEGCPYCGSHSCKSFYAVSSAGTVGCNPKLCPKYNEKKDPVVYCQTCGKKCGDGRNGTCAQFINECDCPICGKHVKGRTCHTCK